MQRNPHSYQIATGYRTFYSLSLIYQPIIKKRLFLGEKAHELYQKEKRVPNAQDFLSFLEEAKEKNAFSVKPQNNIKAFLLLKEE